ISLTTVEDYDPDTNTEATKTSITTARASFGLRGRRNARSFRGWSSVVWSTDHFSPLTTVEEYDPGTDTWAIKASMLTARAGLGVERKSDVKVNDIGGRGNRSNLETTEEQYDQANDTGTKNSYTPTARATRGDED